MGEVTPVTRLLALEVALSRSGSPLKQGTALSVASRTRVAVTSVGVQLSWLG